MAGLFQASGTQLVAGSEMPEGLASQRPWTAFSALDVDHATPGVPTPCHERWETSWMSA